MKLIVIMMNRFPNNCNSIMQSFYDYPHGSLGGGRGGHCRPVHQGWCRWLLLWLFILLFLSLF